MELLSVHMQYMLEIWTKSSGVEHSRYTAFIMILLVSRIVNIKMLLSFLKTSIILNCPICPTP